MYNGKTLSFRVLFVAHARLSDQIADSQKEEQYRQNSLRKERKIPMWRHGDVLIAQIDAVPAGMMATTISILARGKLTGHSHRLENQCYHLLCHALSLWLSCMRTRHDHQQ